jgi:hypothetical protein
LVKRYLGATDSEGNEKNIPLNSLNQIEATIEPTMSYHDMLQRIEKMLDEKLEKHRYFVIVDEQSVLTKEQMKTLQTLLDSDAHKALKAAAHGVAVFALEGKPIDWNKFKPEG